MSEISKGIESFLNFLRETAQLYRISEANEQEANDITQDILHSLELEEHDYHSSAKLAKELKEARKMRRAAKDLMAVTAPVLDWADANRPVIKNLEQLLGCVRKAERNTEGRVYTPRTKRKEG
jgi:hypothetical protein